MFSLATVWALLTSQVLPAPLPLKLDFDCSVRKNIAGRIGDLLPIRDGAGADSTYG